MLLVKATLLADAANGYEVHAFAQYCLKCPAAFGDVARRGCAKTLAKTPLRALPVMRRSAPAFKPVAATAELGLELPLEPRCSTVRWSPVRGP